MTEKQQIQAQINELQERLDKCDEVEPFTCKGEWYTAINGISFDDDGTIKQRINSFSYWQTKEIAEQAYQLQLRHRKMLSFVSQHQELDEGTFIIYYDIHSSEYCMWNVKNSKYPDAVMMTKETANFMLEAIENGSLDLS